MLVRRTSVESRSACFRGVLSAVLCLLPAIGAAQSVAIDGATRYQSIDGFGTCLSSNEPQQAWWQNLYFSDLQASMVRMDLTPAFVPPYSTLSYCSPWFGQPAPLTLDNGGNGPDGTRTRRYTGPTDYSNPFPATDGGCSAPIAVMGPDIDKNALLFDFTAKAVPGLVAQLGQGKAAQLGGFKLYASLWSPAPWVKVSSGNTYSGSASPLPTAVAWPFIWGGNFAGGKLDVSGTPLSQFNDGTADTSALTQFARGLAAFLHGFQNTYNVKFDTISIQNELNFEEFYNSATYPLTSGYIAALHAARAELNAHADLATIRIIGPEDLMGGDPYGMWQYGGGSGEVDKNLHYLADIAADGGVASDLAGFAIHGYGSDGVSSAGANSQLWSWWANGWQTSPAAGIPAPVPGFKSFGKSSWMTETSGERPEWLASSQGDGGFPDQGAFSIAVKIHDALTTGMESAWLYWQLTDGSPSSDSDVQTLTDATQLANAPKYVAAKHFFRYIRPGAQRVSSVVTGSPTLLASAYVLDSAASVAVVLVNEAPAPATVSLTFAGVPAVTALSAFTSASGSLWQSSSVPVSGAAASVSVPGYGVVTLYGAVANFDGGVAFDGGASVDGGAVADAGGGVDGGSPGVGDAGGSGSLRGSCGCQDATTGPILFFVVVPGLFALRRRRFAMWRAS